jgi:hypothetical protein
MMFRFKLGTVSRKQVTKRLDVATLDQVRLGERVDCRKYASVPDRVTTESISPRIC